MKTKEVIEELEALKDGCDCEDPQMQSAIKALDIAIKAVRENTWIPCGERLPEMGEAALLKKLGVKEQFKAIAQEANSVKDVWERGFDLIWGLFDAVTEPAGEGAIYEFLAGPFEMTPKDVRDLGLDELMTNLQQLAAENNLIHFFKFAAKSMK